MNLKNQNLQWIPDIKRLYARKLAKSRLISGMTGKGILILTISPSSPRTRRSIELAVPKLSGSILVTAPNPKACNTSIEI